MKKIIVATDFSEAALNAATYAVKMAHDVHAALVLLHVYELIPNYNEVLINIPIDDIKENAEIAMEAFKNKLLIIDNCLQIEAVVQLGSFADELNALCKTHSAYAVIIGSNHKSNIERMLVGNHTDVAVKYSSWPIIAIPATVVFKPLKHIALAYDFDETLSEEQIMQIKTLAADFNAEIQIINATKENEFDDGFVDLSAQLMKLFAPFQLVFHFIDGQNIDEEIIDYVNKKEIDLLVVMPKFHSFWYKLTHGSHTKNILSLSNIPVMSMHQ
jgi:nucleotide-binding universal stress UspA family protein